MKLNMVCSLGITYPQYDYLENLALQNRIETVTHFEHENPAALQFLTQTGAPGVTV